MDLKSFGYLTLSKTLPRAWKRSELSVSCDLRLALMMSRASSMESATSSCCGRGCCCDLVGAQELGLPVAGHPWDDGCLRLLDPLDFFDFVAPAVVDDDGLQEYGLLEV